MNNQMSGVMSVGGHPLSTQNGDLALKRSVTLCVFGLLISQWIFALYILAVYAANLVMGQPEVINQAGLMTGFVAGDTLGNTVLFAHVIPAALLSIGGVLQIIPFLRSRFPTFHRWNGRFFLTMGLIGALSGLYLTWGRGSRLTDIGALGVTLNGILIPIAVVLAWHFARKRDFTQHARFATHTFLLINGVLFFRLFLMGWYLINQGPNGNSQTLDGPMDLFLSIACYGIPMLFAELYFWAKRQHNVKAKWTVTGVMGLAALFTFTAIFATVTMMWLPKISRIF